VIEVDALAQELSSITPEALKSGRDDDYIKANAPSFGLFFERLGLLLSDNVQVDEPLVLPTTQLTVPTKESHPISQPLNSASTNPTISSTPTSKKRPNSLTLTTTNPTKYAMPSCPKTWGIMCLVLQTNQLFR